MMKKSLATALVVALCVALSVCLSACSDSGSSTDITGDWQVVSIQDGFESITGEDLAMIGQSTTFGFESDGKCWADTAGNVVDGTWKLSGDKLTMTFGGTNFTGTVTPGNITVDNALTLEPLEPATN